MLLTSDFQVFRNSLIETYKLFGSYFQVFPYTLQYPTLYSDFHVFSNTLLHSFQLFMRDLQVF